MNFVLRRPRSAFCWMIVTFVVVQLLLDAAIDSQPVLRDPEFGAKLARLQHLLATQPNRPLLLIVGSSRSSSGIQPSAMCVTGSASRCEPLVFNLALTGYGPIQQLQLFDRLDRIGIHPRWILAEVHPLLLHQDAGVWGEELWMRPDSLDSRDLALVGNYLSQPDDWRMTWARLRIVPAYFYRFQLLNHLSPGWLDTRLRQDGAWRDIDAYGWLPLLCSNDTRAIEERRQHAHQQYAPALENFRVTPTADRALRAFVAAAARRGIVVGFYLMPEGEAFRSWYPPAARREIETYLSGLSADTSVPVFDTTTWCAESGFSDSHHLLAGASSQFSQRFGQEIVVPFLAGAGKDGERPLPRLTRADRDQH